MSKPAVHRLTSLDSSPDTVAGREVSSTMRSMQDFGWWPQQMCQLCWNSGTHALMTCGWIFFPECSRERISDMIDEKTAQVFSLVHV